MVIKQLSLVLDAVSLATRAHQGQNRKDGTTPYVAHPVRVMAIVALQFGVEDSEVLAAAVLHDVLEDTTVDRDDLDEKFGSQVAQYVAELSKDGRLLEEQRERQYMEQLLAASEGVKLCKLADLLDNLTDLTGMSQRAREKKIAHAQETLRLFEPHLKDRWSHALQAVREQIAEAQAYVRHRQVAEAETGNRSEQRQRSHSREDTETL